MKILLYLILLIGVSSAKADASTALFRAVENDSARTVLRLLQQGQDPNAADAHGQTPLVAAIQAESVEVVETLLRHPAIQPDLPNRAGETPLMMAALRARVDWMERLLALGAQVRREGWTPLHYAASSPEVRPVALLLERGAPIDAISPTGTTALMMAARYGAIDAATLLLARGADPTLRARNGADAAEFARGAGRDRLADQLAAAAQRREAGR
jgi:ankyrin repeat protein